MLNAGNRRGGSLGQQARWVRTAISSGVTTHFNSTHLQGRLCSQHVPIRVNPSPCPPTCPPIRPPTRPQMVKQFANNRRAFLSAFARAYLKMASTGAQWAPYP